MTLALRAPWRSLAECRTLVIGGGSVGLLGALILKAWGARNVRLAETNQLRLETAIAAAVDAFDPRATPAEEDAYELVLDAVGLVGTRASATFAVSPGGVISHVGLQERAGNFDARTLTLQEVTLVGVYTYTETELRVSLHALHYSGATDARTAASVFAITSSSCRSMISPTQRRKPSPALSMARLRYPTRMVGCSLGKILICIFACWSAQSAIPMLQPWWSSVVKKAGRKKSSMALPRPASQ